MKKILRTLGIMLVCIGLLVLVYPKILESIYEDTVDNIIADFEDEFKSESNNDNLKYEDLYYAMLEYNKNIYRTNQEGFRDAWSYQLPSFDLTKYGITNNMVGHISIPSIEQRLPIYLGASKANMSLGAVHLTQTSLPIGGDNTNCVIAAHRGSYKAAMFREIEKIKIGDIVYVTNLWETLEYRVCETKVIFPNDISEVKIQSGHDMVTLITCHPYRHNYQRYVVYCERLNP